MNFSFVQAVVQEISDRENPSFLTLVLLLLIILIGLICLFAEFFLFPGLTLTGILGGLCLLAGVILGYAHFDFTTGNVVFFSTLVLSGLVFWFGAKRMGSRRFAVHEVVEGRVNVQPGGLKSGDRGLAVSALRPGGTALFAGQRLEVFTRGEFLDSGAPLEIIEIRGSRITVRESGDASEHLST